MIVDDEAGVRRLVKSALERAGLRVIDAEDGIEALRLLETAKPDLLLTDIRMPRMDGIALAQEVAHRSPDMPILLMSGFADDPARTALAKTNGFIRKPFKPKALVQMVIQNLHSQ